MPPSACSLTAAILCCCSTFKDVQALAAHLPGVLQACCCCCVFLALGCLCTGRLAWPQMDRHAFAAHVAARHVPPHSRLYDKHKAARMLVGQLLLKCLAAASPSGWSQELCRWASPCWLSEHSPVLLSRGAAPSVAQAARPSCKAGEWAWHRPLARVGGCAEGLCTAEGQVAACCCCGDGCCNYTPTERMNAGRLYNMLGTSAVTCCCMHALSPDLGPR